MTTACAKGLTLQRAIHSGGIALPLVGSHGLRATLAAAAVLFSHAHALLLYVYIIIEPSIDQVQ